MLCDERGRRLAAELLVQRSQRTGIRAPYDDLCVRDMPDRGGALCDSGDTSGCGRDLAEHMVEPLGAAPGVVRSELLGLLDLAHGDGVIAGRSNTQARRHLSVTQERGLVSGSFEGSANDAREHSLVALEAAEQFGVADLWSST